MLTMSLGSGSIIRKFHFVICTFLYWLAVYTVQESSLWYKKIKLIMDIVQSVALNNGSVVFSPHASPQQKGWILVGNVREGRKQAHTASAFLLVHLPGRRPQLVCMPPCNWGLCWGCLNSQLHEFPCGLRGEFGKVYWLQSSLSGFHSLRLVDLILQSILLWFKEVTLLLLICVSVYMQVYICECVHVDACIHVYMQMCIMCVHISVYMLCACAYIHLCVCVHMYACVCTQVHETQESNKEFIYYCFPSVGRDLLSSSSPVNIHYPS